MKDLKDFKKSTIRDIYISAMMDTRRPKQSEDRKPKKSSSPHMEQLDIYPVKYRITYHRKRLYYSSGINMTTIEWESMPNTRKDELKEKRQLIEDGFDLVVSNVKDLVKSDTFTLEALNNKMKKGSKTNLLGAFDAKISELKKNEQIGTATFYQCAMKSISAYSKSDLKFSEITPDWCRGYEKKMITDGKTYTTVGMYMRALRTIMNEGLKEGVISPSQYPFKEYQIPTAKGRKMALTVAQIKKVIHHPLSNETDHRYRDLWFFSYLCNGINMNDLLRLKYTDIQNGEIRYYRLKTLHTSRDKTEITAVLLPDMERIIERWGTKGNYIFEGLENADNPTEERRLVQNITRAVNERMKKIGKTLGFGSISTYTARHSFATVLKRGGSSIAFISESLGHSDMKTTASYLDSFEKGERVKNAAQLVNFEE